jgi:hypothetical protein
VGHASIVYGNIIGPPRYDERGLFFHQKNKAVIESLPPDDLIWPWIDRGMFLVQDPESVKMYRDQVIVFGACYKRVEPEWEEWLRKFEAILKQLYWITATIHLDSEIEGRNTYLWICDQPDNFTANDPVPISSWSFSGGPRKFDLY